MDEQEIRQIERRAQKSRGFMGLWWYVYLTDELIDDMVLLSPESRDILKKKRDEAKKLWMKKKSKPFQSYALSDERRRICSGEERKK